MNQEFYLTGIGRVFLDLEAIRNAHGAFGVSVDETKHTIKVLKKGEASHDFYWDTVYAGKPEVDKVVPKKLAAAEPSQAWADPLPPITTAGRPTGGAVPSPFPPPRAYNEPAPARISNDERRLGRVGQRAESAAMLAAVEAAARYVD